ncbi:SDR family NAD(P)-dependent oxidoreductase [Streptomyces canus]|uniref:SDR family NAD(P)-dependent oxidoreductase n=1 Tax=Streptomyces canus TaxID=58343 RepID=UPI002250EB85|nr:SDR family NAD(P)-dependent oxidoreductase [Streptomyces canus]MCX4862081.1 SDR family NAD(P)-dependent oxidoreductase [Streptomyces canus]
MPHVSRRALLQSSSLIGMGILSACTPTPDPADARRDTTAAVEDRYGAGTYNTQEVADELHYIQKNVRAIEEGKGRRILITGSTAGLGQLAAAHLLTRGHRVVAHARNDRRAADVRRDLPDLESVVTGELTDLDQTRALASQINELGAFDVIIHNAGEYGLSGEKMLHANSISPYLLTALIDAHAHLIYLTSDLHLNGDLALDELRSGGTDITYDDSKLQVLTLAMAVARRRPGVRVNAVAPGWVPTLMGFHNGPYAPDNLREGYMTQVWLAEGIERSSQITGEFFFHQEPESNVHASVRDTTAQDELLRAYEDRTGVPLGS